MNLEILYLQLKIITLAIILVSGVGFGLIAVWQSYRNLKEWKKEEAEKKKKENAKTLEERQHDEKIKRALGLTAIPKGYYRKEVRCYNCDTYSCNYDIKKGTTEEDFRKVTFCLGCDVRLDYKRPGHL